MDFVLVQSNLLGHRDLAIGLVVDLRGKRAERVRRVHREAGCEGAPTPELSTLSKHGFPVV